jgi:hypothetical protein
MRVKRNTRSPDLNALGFARVEAMGGAFAKRLAQLGSMIVSLEQISATVRSHGASDESFSDPLRPTRSEQNQAV